MELLSQGLVLLIAGMGIVYAFLAVLVLVMSVSSKFIPNFNHILPDEQPRKRPTKTSSSASDDTAVAIAIAVAASQTA